MCLRWRRCKCTPPWGTPWACRLWPASSRTAASTCWLVQGGGLVAAAAARSSRKTEERRSGHYRSWLRMPSPCSAAATASAMLAVVLRPAGSMWLRPARCPLHTTRCSTRFGSVQSPQHATHLQRPTAPPHPDPPAPQLCCKCVTTRWPLQRSPLPDIVHANVPGWQVAVLLLLRLRLRLLCCRHAVLLGSRLLGLCLLHHQLQQLPQAAHDTLARGRSRRHAAPSVAAPAWLQPAAGHCLVSHRPQVAWRCAAGPATTGPTAAELSRRRCCHPRQPLDVPAQRASHATLCSCSRRCGASAAHSRCRPPCAVLAGWAGAAAAPHAALLGTPGRG